MSIILAYPTVAAPTVQITLPDVEQMPASRPVRMRQVVHETDSGAIIIYSIGEPAVSVFSVHLYPLTFAQVTDIQEFFRYDLPNVGVNGRAKVWQFQDSQGVIMNVRFAQDVIEPIQQSPTAWAVSLTLRQEII